MENKNTVVPENGGTEEEQLIEQARIRREKLAKLVSEGKNPYEQVKYLLFLNFSFCLVCKLV